MEQRLAQPGEMDQSGLILKLLLDRQNREIETVLASHVIERRLTSGRLVARFSSLRSPALDLTEQFPCGVLRIHPEAHRDVGGQFARIVKMRFVTGIERWERLRRAGPEQAFGHMMADLVSEGGSYHGAMMGRVDADERALS